jgi:ISXO2-like transposase domain
VPFVATLSLDDKGHPLRVKLTQVSGFTNRAIDAWAKTNLTPGCAVLSDGLACFAAVTEAGCQHQVIIVSDRKPKDLPEFLWINTIPGNLKKSLGGAYQAFNFAKYASHYLAFAHGSSTVAFSSIRSRCVFSWPPSGLAQTPGFGQLKHLANQETI